MCACHLDHSWFIRPLQRFTNVKYQLCLTRWRFHSLELNVYATLHIQSMSNINFSVIPLIFRPLFSINNSVINPSLLFIHFKPFVGLFSKLVITSINYVFRIHKVNFDELRYDVVSVQWLTEWLTEWLPLYRRNEPNTRLYTLYTLFFSYFFYGLFCL